MKSIVPSSTITTCHTKTCAIDDIASFNQDTKLCECKPANHLTELKRGRAVDPSTCPTIKCRAGFYPIYDSESGYCSCEPDEITPIDTTCSQLQCPEGTHSSFDPKSNQCSCVNGPAPITTYCATVLLCGSGSTPVGNNTIESCSCKVDNEIPKSCPPLDCNFNQHVVYHPELDECTCDVECPDLACVDQFVLTFNQSTNVCTCEPPSTSIKRSPEPEANSPMSPSLTSRSSAAIRQTEDTPPCNIRCQFGLVEGECKCKPEPPVTCMIYCEYGFVPGGGCKCNPEPPVTCMIFCEYGFVPGGACKCNPAPEPTCRIYCEFGFVPGGECKCNDAPVST